MKLSRAVLPLLGFLVTPIGVLTVLLVTAFATLLVEPASRPAAVPAQCATGTCEAPVRSDARPEAPSPAHDREQAAASRGRV